MKRTFLLLLIAMISIANARQVPVNATNLTSSTSLSFGDTVILNKLLYVDSGVTLKIGAGVLFKSAPNAGLVISKGAKIVAEGTAAKPIIFTALADSLKPQRNIDSIPDAGLWNGITILGRARVKTGDNVYYALDTAYYLQGTPKQPKTTYGGTDDNDSSGVLQYVSIRYAGTQNFYKGKPDGEYQDKVDDKLEFNGLALCGVGAKTVVDHVEVYFGLDDGVKILGGSVNLRYVVSAFNQDNPFDIDEGYRGCGQFLFGCAVSYANLKSNPNHEFTDLANFRIEQTGGPDSSAVPAFAHVTLIGSDVPNSLFSDRTIKFCNSIFYNSGILSFNYQSPNLFIANNLFRNPSFPANNWKDFAGSDSERVYMMRFNNDILSIPSASAHDLFIEAVIDYGTKHGLDPRPWDSLSVQYCVKVDTLKNSFFQEPKYSYRGAFDPRDSTIWLQGWTALDFQGYLPSVFPAPRIKRTPPPVSAEFESRHSAQGCAIFLSNSGRSVLITLPRDVRALVSFYNVKGQHVLDLPIRKSGRFALQYKDLGLTNGAYLCRLATPKGCAQTLLTITR